jgi:hypothetical protein
MSQTEPMPIVLECRRASENATAWMAHVDSVTNDDLALS